jgi:hypothetical protein
MQFDASAMTASCMSNGFLRYYQSAKRIAFMMQNGGGIEGGPVAINELQGQVKKLQKGKAAAEKALDNLRQTVKATGQPTHVRLSIFDSYIACMML